MCSFVFLGVFMVSYGFSTERYGFLLVLKVGMSLCGFLFDFVNSYRFFICFYGLLWLFINS